jgi:hypothetical protein
VLYVPQVAQRVLQPVHVAVSLFMKREVGQGLTQEGEVEL